MKKLFLLIMLVVGVIAFALPGQAATIQLGLDTVFPGPPPKPSPDGSAPWLSVYVDDGGSPGSVDLTLTSLLQGTGEKVHQWYLNSDSLLTVDDFSVTAVSNASDFVQPTITTGDSSLQADGDGKFDIKFVFDTSAGNAFDNGDWITYTITATGLTANSFNLFSVEGGGEGTYKTAAQILGIGGVEDAGTWVGHVPIPGSILLLGSGLIGLVGFRRKKIAN